MNNEKKKPVSGETESKATASEKSDGANGANKSDGWWNSLTKNVKIALIAGVSCLVVAVIVLAIVLAGGKDNNGGNNGGNQGDNGDQGNGGGSVDSEMVEYSVTIVTKGGMVFANHPVYFHDYEDGATGDIVAFTTTDENGKATVSVPKNGTYAAKINVDIPEGYDVKSFYPLVDKNLEIVLTSELLPDTGLSSVKYEIGSIMHDFTVTNTEGKQITLSKLFEEKEAVLLNFWFSTCDPCKMEFPLMQSAYEKYQDKLAIIALDPPETQAQDTLEKIKLYKADLGLTFDVVLDTYGLYRTFGVENYPTSVIIDRYGVVTLLHAGAITSEYVFDMIFSHFTAEDYDQKLIYDYSDIVPKEKPNVQMPSSDEISNIFDGGRIPGIEYLPYPDDASEGEKEYSWPFLIDQAELNGELYDVIKTSNAGKVASYSQLIINVPLKAGEVLAFDYFSSTERGADILYVIVDGKDIYSISGQNADGWETCYAYVAEEDATYQIGIIYSKDDSEDEGLDTVFLKDLRIVTEAEVDRPTYIYRFAATKPGAFGVYTEYASIILGDDGYFHVDTVDGPILLADMMGYTRFSDETSVYYMAADLLNSGDLTQAQYDLIIDYCSYASNSDVYGVCPVTVELREMLEIISKMFGNPKDENDWLRLCCYYDAYATDGKQLEDPIKGLAPFSAYDVVLSNPGDTDYPNSITYNKVIMPRGLFAKFTPSESGTYLISSYAPDPANPGKFIDCEAWIFTKSGFGESTAWLTYSNCDRRNVGLTGDLANTYMMAYLEAGKDYYINIAYGDLYQEGTISYRVERLGGEGVFRFSLASPGFFTSLQNNLGGLTETIAGGIEVVLGADGYWHEARKDGIDGSIIYADFTRPTAIFSQSIQEIIEMGGFNLATTEDDEYIKALMKSTQAYSFYLKLYLKELWGADYAAKMEEYMVEDVLAGIYHGEYDEKGVPTKSENDLYILGLRDSMESNSDYNTNDNFKAFLKEYWGEDSYEGYMTEYMVDDVLAGIYHGSGEDYTDAISAYLDKIIVAGEHEELGTITEDDIRLGCVMVDEELAELLTVIMDKYTFEGVEFSWLKLCYYSQYFNAATPN